MASLVQYPGGSKNRGGYGTGNYHVKLILPNSKRVRTFTTGTKNRKYAIKILDRVNNIEKLAKAENGAIIALYNDLKGDNGLVESSILIRKHTEDVKRFNERWWREVKNFSSSI